MRQHSGLWASIRVGGDRAAAAAEEPCEHRETWRHGGDAAGPWMGHLAMDGGACCPMEGALHAK